MIKNFFNLIGQNIDNSINQSFEIHEANIDNDNIDNTTTEKEDINNSSIETFNEKKTDNIKSVITENTDVKKYENICDSYKNLNDEELWWREIKCYLYFGI